MRIGLLGSEAGLLELLHPLARSQVTVTAACRGDQRRLLQLFPSIRFLQHPDELLQSSLVDLVIASGNDNLDEPLRLLARSSVPMVITHPSVISIIGFELEMIRSDLNTSIIPFSVPTAHVATREFLKRVAGSSNPLDQVIVERSLVQATRRAALHSFAADATLIRMLLGEVSQLSAMGTLADGSQNLTAQMNNESGAIARWSLVPSGERGAKAVAVCGEVKHELWMPGDASAWYIDSTGQTRQTFSEWDESEALLSHLKAANEGRALTPTWEQACRGSELAELLEISARRGKTIKVFNERHSEESTFKGIMAAGGCFLLLATLVLLLVMVTIEALEPPFRDHILWRLWPVYLLAPFTIFLLMQTLKLVFPPEDRQQE